MLTNADIAELTDFRRLLHQHPEVSGDEVETSVRIATALGPLDPTEIVRNLGGHGIAAIWASPMPGPTILLRSELDALPIQEISTARHRSTTPGKAHLCGHDGHTTILMALARLLSRNPPAKGRVILMFQPAEEDGSGAACVTADPRYAALTPDYAFALHNMPGIPFGHAHLAPGAFACASQGLKILFTGKTAHASLPHTGTSPALALAALIPALQALGPGGPDLYPGFRLITITHARLGEPAFGISPAHAEVWATLRTPADAPMDALRSDAMHMATTLAAKHGLHVSFTHHDNFAATINDAEAAQILATALDALQIPHGPGILPMRASEDFGRFGVPPTKLAMLLLGAGDGPALHNPDYDFNDALIPLGTKIFHRVLTDLTN